MNSNEARQERELQDEIDKTAAWLDLIAAGVHPAKAQVMVDDAMVEVSA